MDNNASSQSMLGQVVIDAERVQARLEAARLVAREVAHRLNNHLTIVVGNLELLSEEGARQEPPSHFLTMALESLYLAAADIRKFQQLKRVVVQDTALGPTLDLEASIFVEPSITATCT